LTGAVYSTFNVEHALGTNYSVPIACGSESHHAVFPSLRLGRSAVMRSRAAAILRPGASWVTQGPDIGEIALRFGADDFGSVMFEENVVSSAGTTYCIDAAAIEARIRAAGFRSARRNVRYDWLTDPV